MEHLVKVIKAVIMSPVELLQPAISQQVVEAVQALLVVMVVFQVVAEVVLDY
jgi:hypothetical protein